MLKYILMVTLATFSFTVNAFDIDGNGKIYYVIDGDTVLMSDVGDETYKFLKQKSHKKENFDDRFNSIKIRIGNINTKESVHKDKTKNTKDGKEASDYLKKLVEKKNFKFYCWDIGDYGRPICSVYNKNLDIGEHMIKKGYSEYITYWGKNPRWHQRYLKAN